MLRSLLSQDIENQLTKSLKYTVIMLCLPQNEPNSALRMVATGTSVKCVAKLFGCSRVIVHSLVRH